MQLDPAFSYHGLRMGVGQKTRGAQVVAQVSLPERNQFGLEMDHFAQAIRAERVPHTPGAEGLADMRVIEATHCAAKGGGTERLPLVAGLDTTRGPAPQAAG